MGLGRRPHRRSWYDQLWSSKEGLELVLGQGWQRQHVGVGLPLFEMDRAGRRPNSRGDGPELVSHLAFAGDVFPIRNSAAELRMTYREMLEACEKHGLRVQDESMKRRRRVGMFRFPRTCARDRPTHRV